MRRYPNTHEGSEKKRQRRECATGVLEIGYGDDDRLRQLWAKIVSVGQRDNDSYGEVDDEDRWYGDENVENDRLDENARNVKARNV